MAKRVGARATRCRKVSGEQRFPSGTLPITVGRSGQASLDNQEA
jgi:hypothetical protein